MLREYIEYELKWSIFCVGQKCVKQAKGLPMGGPISPGLAILDSIRKEDACVGVWRRRDMLVRRFRDDILVLVGVWWMEEACRETESAANKLYGDGLRVELEEWGYELINFVGCEIRCEGQKLTSYVINPNVQIRPEGT